MGKKAFYETDEFQKLREQWYSKLDKDSFDDIEKSDKNGIVQPQVVVQHKRRFNGSNDYHELCQTILREFHFKRPVDRFIFELHTAGRSVREIESELVRKGGRSLKKTAIDDAIKRIKESFLKGTDQ